METSESFIKMVIKIIHTVEMDKDLTRHHILNNLTASKISNLMRKKIEVTLIS